MDNREYFEPLSGKKVSELTQKDIKGTKKNWALNCPNLHEDRVYLTKGCHMTKGTRMKPIIHVVILWHETLTICFIIVNPAYSMMNFPTATGTYVYLVF